MYPCLRARGYWGFNFTGGGVGGELLVLGGVVGGLGGGRLNE